MGLASNIGIGKEVYSFFKYINRSSTYLDDREQLNALQSKYEELSLLPDKEEVLDCISRKLLYPSEEYKIWLLGSWKKTIEVHLTYYTITGDLYESRLMQIDPGIHIWGENETPKIVLDADVNKYAERLVNMNIGYKFHPDRPNVILYKPNNSSF